MTFSPTIFDRYVLALDKSGFGQTSAKRAKAARPLVSRLSAEISDDRYRLLLRACREWPRCRHSEERYELAPPHPITPWMLGVQ
jgi:hypothetical protein